MTTVLLDFYHLVLQEKYQAQSLTMTTILGLCDISDK